MNADEPLTRREFEIYMLIVAKGMSIAGIANRLGISPNTVRQHQFHILKKMNMATALELLVQYQRKERP